MIVPPRALDCAPLTPAAGARLSASDLRRIEPLQQALLTPLDHPTLDDWRKSVNRALRGAFHSDAAMFQLDAAGVTLQYSDEFAPSHLDQYVHEQMPDFSGNRQLYRRATELKAGNRAILWSGDLEWLYGSDYFHELVLPMYAFDPLWAAAPMPGSRYPAMIHTYHDRRRSRHFFGAADVALMRVVQPALQAAVRTLVRAGESRSTLEGILAEARDDALVYDLDGRLLYQSPAAASLARTRQGDETIEVAARAMARGLAARSPRALLESRHADQAVRTRSGSYRLNAVLLGEGVFTLRAAVLVTVVAGDRRLPEPQAIRKRHGLTRRQAEVALLLAQRKTNLEIADELCISRHTVRSHTEAVMGKLGVSDRRDVERALRE